MKYIKEFHIYDYTDLSKLDKEIQFMYQVSKYKLGDIVKRRASLSAFKDYTIVAVDINKFNNSYQLADKNGYHIWRNESDLIGEIDIIANKYNL